MIHVIVPFLRCEKRKGKSVKYFKHTFGNDRTQDCAFFKKIMYEYLTNVNCKYVYNYTGEKLNLILFKFSLLVDYEDILSTVLE